MTKFSPPRTINEAVSQDTPRVGSKFSPEVVETLRAELRGVHDALGILDDFEVREPDLHLTRNDCRAILRDAIDALAKLCPNSDKPIISE